MPPESPKDAADMKRLGLHLIADGVPVDTGAPPQDAPLELTSTPGSEPLPRGVAAFTELANAERLKRLHATSSATARTSVG